MIVYKVVREEGGALLSFNTRKDHEPTFCLEYTKDVMTVPPKHYPNAWLFAFKDLAAAFEFARYNTQVWEAESTTIEPAPNLCWLQSDKNLKKFWKDLENGKNNKLMILVPPPGSVFCKDITLIKRVNDASL